MSQSKQDNLSPAQLEIMDVIWESGEAGVADIWGILAARRPIARNTVQTTLSRLHEKGWLRCRQEGNAFFYAAVLPRKRVVGRLVSRLVDTAFGGSAAGLVLTLLEGAKVSPDEARRIRDLIDRSEQRGSSGKKGV